MKYLKYTLCTALVLLVSVACDVNSDKFPTDLEELHKQENTGGFVRIVNVQQGAFDLLDIPNAAFQMTIEVDDAQNGGQLESVEFFVGYSDNADQTVGDLEAPDDPILTLGPSDFTENEDTGLPRTDVNITAPEAMDYLGIEESDLGSTDTFEFQWTLNLTNGKSIDADNTGSNISGGAFYSSPFQRSVVVGRLVPEDTFVGTYTLSQDRVSAGPARFGNGYIFDGDGDGDITIELQVDPENQINGRIFNATYLPEIGFSPEQTWSIVLLREETASENQTNWIPQAASGITCTGGDIVLGEPATTGTFDVSDPSEFSLVIREDALGDCGPFDDVPFTLTKQ